MNPKKETNRSRAFSECLSECVSPEEVEALKADLAAACLRQP